MREWEIGAVENIHGALPYIRFAPLLTLVGVGVNRIGKVCSIPIYDPGQECKSADTLRSKTRQSPQTAMCLCTQTLECIPKELWPEVGDGVKG